MTDPDRIQDDAVNVVLHAWIAAYLHAETSTAAANIDAAAGAGAFAGQFAAQAARLRESALLLQAALDKMRLANERLAARMAEHKAFFAKYQAPPG